MRAPLGYGEGLLVAIPLARGRNTRYDPRVWRERIFPSRNLDLLGRCGAHKLIALVPPYVGDQGERFKYTHLYIVPPIPLSETSSGLVANRDVQRPLPGNSTYIIPPYRNNSVRRNVARDITDDRQTLASVEDAHPAPLGCRRWVINRTTNRCASLQEKGCADQHSGKELAVHKASMARG